MQTVHTPEALRRHEIAILAQALRAHLQWQTELGADGAPLPGPEALQAWEGELQQAQTRKREQARRALEQETLADTPAVLRQPERPPAVSDAAAPPSRGPAPAKTDAPRPNPRKSQPPTGQNLIKTFMRSSETPARRQTETSSGPITLAQVREDLGECTRCKLHKTRRNIVFGIGDSKADLVFIGEAPGFHEDKTGEPFVGKAGHLLTRMIGAMGHSRESVYICNIIKCRPPGNRDPETDELSRCEPFLIKQLRALRPKVIVTLGRFAARSLLRESTPITRLRGNWRSYQGVPVMPTLHPAYILRNPASKREVWADLQQVMASLKDQA